MRAILFLCLSLIYAGELCAQLRGTRQKVKNYQRIDNKAFHWGMCIGLNTMNFSIEHDLNAFKNDSLLCNTTKPRLGFQVQAVLAARLNDFLELRWLPGILMGERHLFFYKNNDLYDDKHRLESSYLTMPLLLKYRSARVNNFRAYVIGGVDGKFDLARTYRESEDVFMDLKLFDPAYEFGAGVDLYLRYFKMSLELRASWGVRNVLKIRDTPRPEFSNSLSRLRSSSYMFSIYFE